MDYELGGSRRRNFGMGILTGSALEGGDLVKGVQQNLNFRLSSAMDVLSGSSTMSPVNRRQQLMSRRRNLIRDTLGMGDSSDTSDTSSDRRRSRGSGRISDSGGSGTSSSSTSADTPSMSDVEVGTKARAEERGFGG